MPGDDEIEFGDEDAYRAAADTGAEIAADSGVPEYMEQVKAVFSEEFKDRLPNASDSVDAQKEYAAIRRVLKDIAEESGEPEWIIEYVEDNVRQVSQATGNRFDDDKIISSILPPLREVHREKEEEKLRELAADPDHEYTVDRDDAIGTDEYVEQYLDRVVRQETRDYDTEPTYRFEFTDGAIVEFDDGDHRHYAVFQETVSKAAKQRVLKELASRQALDDIESDIETDFAQERYRELSHGPESRPWGLDEVDWWDEVITSLEDKAELDVSRGPNEDALDDLKSMVRRAEAAHDLQSVVDAGDGAIHYAEEHDEFWIPNHMIDNAWEDYATSRQSFRKELSHRGITSDELSGDKAVESVFSTDPPKRFWRLKASELPEPDRYVDEIERGSTGFADAAGYAESVDAATDGGFEDDGEDNTDDAGEGGDN